MRAKIKVKAVGMVRFTHKTPYIEEKEGLTAEEQMLSNPYYNPLELKGEELEILNKQNERSLYNSGPSKNG